MSAWVLPLHDAELAAADPLFRTRSVGDLFGRIQAVRHRTYKLWDHSLAVSVTSLRLARGMDLDFETCAFAFFGGLLHDVGKSMTRFETLFKAGPLTDAERMHLQEHPVDGARMVRNICPEAIVAAVRHHHELFDGTGYPDGLRGEDIPLIARVVGVADYYEALRENRSYRPGRDPLESLRVVTRQAEDGRLDPTIVDALVRAV